MWRQVATLQNAAKNLQAQLNQLQNQAAGSVNKGAAVAADNLLFAKQQQLLGTATLEYGGAELIVQASVPTSAVSPQPIRDGALSGLVGPLLALAFVFCWDQMGESLRSRQDIEGASRLSVLAKVRLGSAQECRCRSYQRFAE